MIQIAFLRGLSCPVFACDVCGGELTDPDMAMAAWSEDGGRDGKAPVAVAHVHKGRCLDAFEEAVTPARLMTDELTDHVAFLVTNSGMAPELVRERLRRQAGTR